MKRNVLFAHPIRMDLTDMTRLEELEMALALAPKGRTMLAQGNALGGMAARQREP